MVKIIENVKKKFNVKAELCKSLNKVDLQELCDATEEAILAGGGFGWISPPALRTLQNYWKGVLLIPERTLIVGKLDSVVAGSVQLIKPTKNNEAQAHSCILSTFFFAPWARGFGLAKAVFEKAEEKAKKDGFKGVVLYSSIWENESDKVVAFREIVDIAHGNKKYVTPIKITPVKIKL